MARSGTELDRANLEGRQVEGVVGRSGIPADVPGDSRADLQRERKAAARGECKVVAVRGFENAGPPIQAHSRLWPRVIAVGSIEVSRQGVAAVDPQCRGGSRDMSRP